MIIFIAYFAYNNFNELKFNWIKYFTCRTKVMEIFERKKKICCFENIFQLTKQGAALRAVCHLQVAHLFDWMKTGVGQYVGNRLIKQCDHLRPDRYASNAVLVTSHSLWMAAVLTFVNDRLRKRRLLIGYRCLKRRSWTLWTNRN